MEARFGSKLGQNNFEVLKFQNFQNLFLKVLNSKLLEQNFEFATVTHFVSWWVKTTHEILTKFWILGDKSKFFWYFVEKFCPGKTFVKIVIKILLKIQNAPTDNQNYFAWAKDFCSGEQNFLLEIPRNFGIGMISKLFCSGSNTFCFSKILLLRQFQNLFLDFQDVLDFLRNFEKFGFFEESQCKKMQIVTVTHFL